SLDSTQRLGILFKEDTINFALEISRRTYERGSKYSGFISGEKFRYAAGVEKFLINKHSGEPRPSIRGMGDFPKLFNQEGRGEYLIALRAGFNWASALDSKNITTGVGVNIGNFLIDYGWSFPLSGIEETSGNHSLSLLFRFGKILFKEKKLTEKLVEPVELDYPPLPGSISTSITPTVAVVPMPGQLIVPGPGAMSVPAVPRITSGATVPFGPLPREAVTSYYIPPYISSAAALGVVRVSTTTEKYETLKQELISKMAISTPSIKTEGLKQTPLPAPPTFGAIPPVPEAGALPETDGLKAPEPSGVKSQGVSMPSAPGAAPSVPGIGGLPAIIPLPGLPLGSGKKAAAEAPEKVTAPKTGDRPQELPSEVSGKVEVPRRATAVSPVTSVPAVSKPPGTAPAVTAPAVPEKKTVPSEEVPGKRTYKVERGETLSSIAQKLYGDSGKWIKIYEANKDKIVKGIVKPGQKLIIPHKK
ncbi:MAG: LysM peptidoglycan-binding domain-containing protein, partial [Elusimicrobiota bacterium]